MLISIDAIQRRSGSSPNAPRSCGRFPSVDTFSARVASARCGRTRCCHVRRYIRTKRIRVVRRLYHHGVAVSLYHYTCKVSDRFFNNQFYDF